MSKRIIIILAATIGYSILFYHQNAGLNFLLFNVLLVSLSIWLYPENRSKLNFWFAALLSILSGLAVAINASSWAIWMSVITTLNFSLAAGSGSSTVWLNLFHALFTQASSLIFIIIEWAEKKVNPSGTNNKKTFTGIFLTLFIIILVLLFIFLYKNTNPVFALWTQYINFDWLSFEWLMFTLGGMLLLYPFFKPRTINSLLEIDQLPELINPETKSKLNWLGIDKETSASAILFAILNILLFFVNGIDIYYLYFNQHLPSGMNHSDFVHEGIGSLITSILIGSFLLIYLFRAELNFSEKNTLIKALSILWLLQNLFLISSTLFRNQLYVEEFQLTYKRIGVFIYLLLAVFGILSLCYKIIKKKNLLFLFRINSLSFFIFFTLLSFIDFDRLITKFNIKNSKNYEAIDKWYLTFLDGNNCDQLAELRKKCDFNESTIKSSYNTDEFSSERIPTHYYENSSALDQKIYGFLKNENCSDLRSYSIRSNNVLKSLNQLSAKGNLCSFDLSNYYAVDLSALVKLPLVHELKINSSGFNDFKNLSRFPYLFNLSLNNNYIADIDSLPAISQLQNLSLNNNIFTHAEALSKFYNLRKLELINCGLTTTPSWKRLNKLTSLNLSENPIQDFRGLQNLHSLQQLTLNNMSGNLTGLPTIKTLKELSIAFNENNKIYAFILKSVQNNSSLTKLNISNNKLLTLEFLQLEDGNPALKHLKVLDLSSNRILQLSALQNYTGITTIYVNGNELKSLCGIENNYNLIILDASQNNLSNIYCLKENKTLQVINVSNNPELNDLNCISDFMELRELRISNCGINNFKFLQSLKKLEILEMRGYEITDWTFLKNLQNLNTIYISILNKEASDIIMNLPKLNNIYVDRCDDKLREKLNKKGIKINGK